MISKGVVLDTELLKLDIFPRKVLKSDSQMVFISGTIDYEKGNNKS